MKLREGSKGKFYGCSTFPECRGTADFEGEQEKCPACGGNMVVKNGKRGRFYGCSNYPECKNTKDYKEQCPKCGSDMVKRSGKSGDFLGCMKYPECKGTRSIGPVKKDPLAVALDDTTDYSQGEDEVPF